MHHFAAAALKRMIWKCLKPFSSFPLSPSPLSTFSPFPFSTQSQMVDLHIYVSQSSKTHSNFRSKLTACKTTNKTTQPMVEGGGLHYMDMLRLKVTGFIRTPFRCEYHGVRTLGGANNTVFTPPEVRITRNPHPLEVRIEPPCITMSKQGKASLVYRTHRFSPWGAVKHFLDSMQWSTLFSDFCWTTFGDLIALNICPNCNKKRV